MDIQFPTKKFRVKTVDCMFCMQIPVKLKHKSLCCFCNVSNSQYFETWCTLIDCMLSCYHPGSLVFPCASSVSLPFCLLCVFPCLSSLSGCWEVWPSSSSSSGRALLAQLRSITHHHTPAVYLPRSSCHSSPDRSVTHRGI